MTGPAARRRRAGTCRAAGLPWALAAVVLLGLAAAPPAGADPERIYRWVDDRGVPHFTDRPEEVPEAFRDPLGLPDAPPGAAAPGPGARAVSEDEGAGPGVESLPGWMRMDESPARQVLRQAPTGMLAAGAFVVLVFAGLVVAFGAVVLLLACRLVGQESPGFRKAYGITIVQFLALLVVSPGVIVLMAPAQGAGGLLGVQTVNFGATLLSHAAILRAMLCESFGRALAIAVMGVVVSFVLGIALALGFVTCGVGSAVLRAAG